MMRAHEIDLDLAPCPDVVTDGWRRIPLISASSVEHVRRAARNEAWRQLKSSLGRLDEEVVANMAEDAYHAGGGVVRYRGSRHFRGGETLCCTFDVRTQGGKQ